MEASAPPNNSGAEKGDRERKRLGTNHISLRFITRIGMTLD
jgi:hypothetical protein